MKNPHEILRETIGMGGTPYEAMIKFGKQVFEDAQKEIWADLEQTELCHKYYDYEEYLNQLK